MSASGLAAQVGVFRQVAFSDFSTGPPAFPSLRLSEHQRLVHAPAPSVELHEPTVVGDPVDRRGREPVVAGHGTPPAGPDVGRDDRAAPLVATTHHLGQRPRAVSVGRDVARLADDGRARPRQVGHGRPEPGLRPRPQGRRHEPRRREEPSSHPAPGASGASRDGQVGLAPAGQNTLPWSTRSRALPTDPSGIRSSAVWPSGDDTCEGSHLGKGLAWGDRALLSGPRADASTSPPRPRAITPAITLGRPGADDSGKASIASSKKGVMRASASSARAPSPQAPHRSHLPVPAATSCSAESAGSSQVASPPTAILAAPTATLTASTLPAEASAASTAAARPCPAASSLVVLG